MTNPTNNTLSNVIVDSGNGKVLYTSPGISINLTQFAMKGMTEWLVALDMVALASVARQWRY